MVVMAHILLRTNIKKIIILVVEIIILDVKILFLIIKMLTIIRILVKIEYYYTKK